MCTLFIVFTLQLSLAQEKTITGIITDQGGLPLPGANVLVKGTTNGTQTDFDGNYAITASEGATLVFTYIGMRTEERVVGASSVINVQLAEDAQALEEVVVVGFGEKTRKQLTTSISSVEVDDVKSIATPTVSGALQGSVTGLQVSQNSGTPGAGFSVRVRGASTINGSNEPLYVVDGVPLLTGDLGGGGFGGQTNDALATLNFADVESIEVLKDASATAIYGSQAANGVVLITTKRGKAGKLNVEINSYVGSQDAIKRWDVAPLGEALQYADIAWDAAIGAPEGFGAFSQGFILGYNYLENTGLGSLEELYQYDVEETYVDAIYRNSAIVKSTDVSLSGGTDKARFFLQVADYQQEGAIKNQYFGRKSARLNADFQASESVRLDAGFTVTESRVSRVNGDNNIYSGLTTSLLEWQGYPLRDEFGNLTRDNFLFSNPLQNVLEENSDEITLRILANTGLNIDITDNLSFNTKFSLERLDFRQDRFFPATTAQGAAANGDAFAYINLYTNYVNNTTFNYNTNFGDWELNALAGFSFQGTDTNQSTLNTQNFPSGFDQTANGSDVIQADNFNTERKIFSYLSRVGLSWKDKFFLEGSIRADASSVFGKGNQIGYFPAASAAYIISDDSWFENPVFTNLKVRASWGQTGNQTGLGNFASRGLIGAVNVAGIPGTSITQLENPNLKWEVTTQTNFGTDIQLFKFLDLSYDFYIKETDDLLLARSLRNSSGFLTVTDNVGAIENIGHEIGITARILSSDAFSWTSQLNLSFNENEVTRLVRDANGEFLPLDTGFASRTAVGQPLGSFFGLVYDGIYLEGDEIPAPLQARGVSVGDVRYIDTNGDGNITPDDRQFIGNPNPGLIGNFRNSFRFAGFDLSGNFQFEFDRQIYNNSLGFAGPGSNTVFGFLSYGIDDYWTPDNPDATQPRPRTGGLQAYNSEDSSQYIEDADYVRLKEVVLGYTFTPTLWDTQTSIRVYAGGDNLITITDYSGLDPEVNTFGASNVSRGTDFFTQGLNKVYKFGVNIKF
ncbi:SusC/RagA family TonB-linked outer membrane protein [Robertkochia flava]|uniref:SusC/RagA family TonB-linked outer membrane protein n=1 Tax=Robertkochia flava TaxID=3447986 RepID=UPI001CCBD9F5|nr:TonB-dependent receptor [Robertkochia marina]